MVLSFSSRSLADSVSLIKQRLRNLKNPALAPYYSASPVSVSQERLDESTDYRADAGLVAVDQSVTVSDLDASNGFSLFYGVTRGAGVEEKFSEDLVTSTNNRLPLITTVAAYLNTIAADSSDQVSGVLGRTNITYNQETLHLLETQPRRYADDIEDLYTRMLPAFSYIRTLIK